MKNEQGGNTNEKMVWMIGIAIIIFLILLLGSLIGMKITRDKLTGMVDSQGNVIPRSTTSAATYYEVLEDGRKRNNSEKIKSYDVDADLIRFSNFEITEDTKGNTSVAFKIENISEETFSTRSYSIALYDDAEHVLSQFSVMPNLEAHQSTYIIQPLENDCLNAYNVEVVKN